MVKIKHDHISFLRLWHSFHQFWLKINLRLFQRVHLQDFDKFRGFDDKQSVCVRLFVRHLTTLERKRGEEVLKYVWRSSRGDGRPDKQFWPLMTTPWVNLLRNLGPPYLVCLFAYLGNIGQPNHGLIIDIQFRVFFNNLPSQNRIILPLFWTVIFVFSIHR